MMKMDDCVKLFDVGDELYRVCRVYKSDKLYVDKIKIVEVESFPHYVYRDNFGRSYFNHSISKSCFKTEAEAYDEIQKRYNKTKKRELLQAYERELNEKLNLGDHYLVK